MSLDGLFELSISIIQTAISHPLGIYALPDSGNAPFNPKELLLLDLHAQLDALSREIAEEHEATGLSERRLLTQNFDEKAHV